MSDEEIRQPALGFESVGKAAQLLVEKFGNAGATLWSPADKLLTALADGKEAIIREENKMELEALQARHRGLRRFLSQMDRQQNNLEAIVSRVVEELSDGANKVSEVEEDWLAEFAQKCCNTSDEDVRAYWSNMLLNECQSPGTFSKRAIARLAELSPNEAHEFERLATYVWFVRKRPELILPEAIHPVDELMDAGLIEIPPSHGAAIAISQGDVIQYGSWQYKAGNTAQVDLHEVRLTRSGRELIHCCSPKYEEPRNTWRRMFKECMLSVLP